MSLAFRELFAIDGAFDGIPMAGRTDASIVRDAALRHAIRDDSPQLATFPDVYRRHLIGELEKPGPRKGIMPGVRELLDTLAPRDDVYLALLTGNYEATAQLKLEYFDLWRYFRCGAFGDAAPERNHLLPKAIAQVVACGGPPVAAAQSVIIGDTPLDIAVALAGGARSIGVATGSHSAEALRAAGADVVFDDLSNTPTVIRVLGSFR